MSCGLSVFGSRVGRGSPGAPDRGLSVLAVGSGKNVATFTKNLAVGEAVVTPAANRGEVVCFPRSMTRKCGATAPAVMRRSLPFMQTFALASAAGAPKRTVLNRFRKCHLDILHSLPPWCNHTWEN